MRVCNSITGKCCCGRRRNSFKLSSKVWIYASPQLQLENICAACCIGLMLGWCCSQKVIKMSEMLQTHKTTFLLSWFLHLGRKQEVSCRWVKIWMPRRHDILAPFFLWIRGGNRFSQHQVPFRSGRDAPPYLLKSLIVNLSPGPFFPGNWAIWNSESVKLFCKSSTKVLRPSMNEILWLEWECRFKV